MIRAIRIYISSFFVSLPKRKVVYEQDPESNGWSAHYENAPETFGQGATQKDALKSLEETTKWVEILEKKDKLKKAEHRKLQHA